MITPKGNEMLMASASYILGPITGIVMLVLERQSQFVRFHAMQSTVAFGGMWLMLVALGYFPIIGWLFGSTLALVGFILWIVLLWKSFQGEVYKLPYVGDIAEKQLARLDGSNK